MVCDATTVTERLGQALAAHYKGYMPTLLFELYCGDPDQLFKQYSIARQLTNADGSKPSQEEVAEILEEPDEFVLAALKLQRFHQFLASLLPLRDSSMILAFRKLAAETAFVMLDQMKVSKVLREYMTATKHPSQPREGSPFGDWLERSLLKGLRRFCSDISTYTKAWKSPGHAEQLARRGIDLESQFDERIFQLAFAPSGSGKTASIIQELTRNYGFYIVSGSLLEEDSSPGNLNPKTLPGVSKDTRRLFETVKHAAELGGLEMDLVENLMELWKAIFSVRLLIFRLFCHSLPADRISPSSWLSFQLDCSDWDPFSDIFRVVSLQPLGFPLEDVFPTIRPAAAAADPPNPPDIAWVCIDEAQEDLRIQLSPNPSINLLGFAIRTIAFLPVTWRAIFAGTSLDLSNVMKTVDTVLLEGQWLKLIRESFGISSISLDYNLLAKFPLVIGRNDAKGVLGEVMRANGLAATTPNLVDRAVDESSELLRGRVKWTAMYAEAIVKKVKEKGTPDLSAVEFSDLAQKTYREVVEELWDRLAALRKRRDGEKLLGMLLEAAISADILDRPHIFLEKGSMELVDEGFAVVDCPSGTTYQQRASELADDFDVRDESGNKMWARLRSGHSCEDGTATLLTGVVKNRWTIQGCTVNSLTAEEAKRGFTIVDCSVKRLAIQLKEHGFQIVKKSKDQLTVKLSKGDAMARKRMDELAKLVAKGDFTVEGCTMNEPTKESMRVGFTIWGDSDRKTLNKKLEKLKFSTDKKSTTRAQLMVEPGQELENLKSLIEILKKGKMKLVILNKEMGDLENMVEDGLTICQKPGHASQEIADMLTSDFELEPKPDNPAMFKSKLKESSTTNIDTDSILAVLQSKGFYIVNEPDELAKLVKSGLTILLDAKASLAAKLAEPVVIDAIIRFSFQLLDQKLMGLINLVPDTSALGSPAERYLAMRLGRYLSDTIRTSDLRAKAGDADGEKKRLQESWENSRQCILKHLSGANNHEAKSIGDLGNYALVVGSRTIRNFGSERDWEDGFLSWLDAIKNGHRWPSASFLLPHKQFGPDIVFALRTKDKKSIILCSIQLKLGAMTSQDAVNKSSVSWACRGRWSTAEEEKAELTNEQKTWGDLQESLEKNLPEELKLAAQKLIGTELERLKQKLETRAVLEKEETRLKKEKETWANIRKNLKGTKTNLPDAQEKLLVRQHEGVNKDLIEVTRRLQEMDAAKGSSKSIVKIREVLEDDFWQGKLRLSLLVGARATAVAAHDNKPKTSRPGGFEAQEYFAILGQVATEDLFGSPFNAILDVLQP
ncbi:hypothetical protein B0T24DRAFT_114295 [Lasiosphaeria ovina]|uniref:Uncharacterized protein n=1 Tax=Lasiosphaeria ovina TaxID=92902 RepID=A0AAE0MYI9_9PEZI|nr:hypothetical protein B0T24DRAFT_114295 [Lasiosphaeria ovina]